MSSGIAAKLEWPSHLTGTCGLGLLFPQGCPFGVGRWMIKKIDLRISVAHWWVPFALTLFQGQRYYPELHLRAANATLGLAMCMDTRNQLLRAFPKGRSPPRLYDSYHARDHQVFNVQSARPGHVWWKNSSNIVVLCLFARMPAIQSSKLSQDNISIFFMRLKVEQPVAQFNNYGLTPIVQTRQLYLKRHDTQ